MIANAYELLIWVPEYQSMVYMQEGSGEQLLPEDYANGYNAYIDYTVSIFEDNVFHEDDGGIYMYRGSSNWQNQIGNTLKYIFDTDKVPNYYMLKVE